VVSLEELAWETNEEEDGFYENDFNLCLLLVQIIGMT
jgi:hypothetical protein